MSLTIHIPESWKPDCSISFAKWYKEKVKSKHLIDEDYNLIK